MLFRDFLDALRQRGHADKADRYEHEFLNIYYPLISKEELLEIPFDDLCEATSLLAPQNSMRMPRLDQTNICFKETLGEWYVNQLKGKLRKNE